MRLEVHSEARAEFLHAVSFYEAQVPVLESRFTTEIERCQKVLLEASLIGRPYGRRLRKFTLNDRHSAAVILRVRVKPNSRSSSLTQEADGSWRAQLKAPPVDGKANAELVALVAEHFQCSKASVVIKSGGAGRNKLVRVGTS